MANGYESQKVGRRSSGGMEELMQVLKMFQGDSGARQRKVASRTNSLMKLIEVTNDYDDMSNLRQQLVKADKDFDNKGYDAEGDILLQVYDNKFHKMQRGQNAYNELSKMKLDITSPEEFDKVKNDILDQDWSEVNKNLRNMFVLQSQLEDAKDYRLKGTDDLDPSMLQTTVSQYQGFYANKLGLLAKTGVYDIPDEQIQDFDEQFGVQLMSLSPTDFSKMMGQHQNYVQGLYANAESEANRYYDKMVKAENSATGSESSDFPIAGIDIGEILSVDEWRTRYEEKQLLAQNLNERHNQFYGQYFSEDKRFVKGFEEKDAFKDKLKGGFTTEDDDDTKKDLGAVTIEGEAVERKPIIHKYKEPPIQIIWDKEKGKEITTKPTSIEKTLEKRLKKEDMNESIQSTNFVKKDTGESINIIEYSKDENVYIDENGNKFNEEDIIVSSIDELKPKLKKANGDFYYWNPVGKKMRKWGQDEIFKNQKIEKLIIGGRAKSVPVNTINRVKFHWIDGKWKHLPKR